MHVAAPHHRPTDIPAAILNGREPGTIREATPSSANGNLGRALAGLIGRGHGREACAVFLGLPDAALMDRIAVLGLPAPRDLPLRLRRGARAWSLPDIQRLIDLWCHNLPGSRIGCLLGRSEGGVHAKARRLGLPRRPRSALVRGPFPPPSPAPDRPPAQPEPAKSGRRGVEWSMGMEDDLAGRWFALQGHRGIARDLGLSPTAVASKAHRLQLPQRFGLALSEEYRPERRDASAHLFPGWTRRVCNIRKRPFWTRHKGIVFSDEARRQATWRALHGSIH